MKRRRAPTAVRRARHRLIAGREALRLGDTSGDVFKNEYVTDKRGSRKRALIVGVSGPQGGISSNPVNKIAYAIRSALSRPPLAPVIVYNAAGIQIGTINPLTRERISAP